LQDGRVQTAGSVREVAREAGVPTTISFTAPGRLRSGDVAAPGCLEVEVRGDVARCRVPSAAVALRELLAWAATNGLGDLDDLTVETPTLEDAYLRLVDGGTR
jgi:hypothetical protein